MSEKTKDKIVFRDLARKFEWFTDEIGDMEVQSIIIPDDLPKIIEVFGVLNKKRVYVKIHMHRSTLDLQEVMGLPVVQLHEPPAIFTPRCAPNRCAL